MLASLHSRRYHYICRRCGHNFRASTLQDMFAPHGVGIKGAWKYLRCQKCSRWSRARIIRAKK